MKLGVYNKLSLVVILILTSIYIFYIFQLGHKILDPGDGLKHFLISKYSWRHPSLFFNHWGKPFFTLLSSPFAQFGFKGMLFFNTLMFVISSVLLLRIAKLLKLNNKFFVIVLCFAAPVYFRIVLSGLTEILFATMIVVVLYLFLKRNFLWGTILLSFLYFSRPESLLVIPWFVFYLIVEKQYKYLPFILTGTILYSGLGYFTHNDIFWVFTMRPYSSMGAYGSGELLHFISNYKSTFGTFSTIFGLIGLSVVIFNFVKKKFSFSVIEFKWLLLIVFPVFSVIGVHSVLWWKGMQGSAGLLRIVATIIPFSSLIALYGINKIFEYKKIAHFQKAATIVLVIFSVVLMINAVKYLEIDKRVLGMENVLLEAAEWYSKEYKTTRIYYMPSYFAYQANLDPFGENTHIETLKYFYDKNTPSNNMKDGELVLWEGQFCEIGGKLPLEILKTDKRLILLKSFYPKEAFKVWGQSYQVHIFQKVENINN